MPSKGRVLMAMSGGVDSSTAAALLKSQGYDVIGATMQVWDYSQCEIVEGEGTCCSSIDVEDARAVADLIDIPFYVLNCESQFREKVIDPFVQSYLQGHTPLPCVDCNTYLKFDHLIRKMAELDCQFLATGHYAQVVPTPSGALGIQTSSDRWKDQTYFLFTIDPAILPRLIFPIGHLQKDEVRNLARQFGLSVASKKDSTGICFVGQQGYQKFVEAEVPTNILNQKRGDIKLFPTGSKLGTHEGIHRFTYGQSRGLGLDHHEKLFVIKIDGEKNVVWVGEEKYLYRDSLMVKNFKQLLPMKSGDTLNVKIRYAHVGAEARIEQMGETWKVQFKEPQRAITPGQACVFYQDEVLMGGGWIV